MFEVAHGRLKARWSLALAATNATQRPPLAAVLVRSNLTSDWSKLDHNFWAVAMDTAMLIAVLTGQRITAPRQVGIGRGQ